MSDFENLNFAKLSPEDLESIQRLEKKLGPKVRLVAVESKDVSYALEAKTAPNTWIRVDRVYPEIKGMEAYFADVDRAKASKKMLKSFLLNNNLSPKPKKRPIRIRQIVNTEG